MKCFINIYRSLIKMLGLSGEIRSLIYLSSLSSLITSEQEYSEIRSVGVDSLTIR